MKKLSDAIIYPRSHVTKEMVQVAALEGYAVQPTKHHITIGTKRTERPFRMTGGRARKIVGG